MRAEELQRFATLLAFVYHGFIADIRGRFLVDQADGAQLLLPPLAAHLPQFAIPPVRAQHARQRRWDQFIRHRLAAALFAAQPLKGRRDDLKAHGFCSNPFPCLADFFWFNIVTDKQITAGRIKTHAHMCRNQRGKALDLLLIHFRQYQQPLQPVLARHEPERRRHLAVTHALQPLKTRPDCFA